MEQIVKYDITDSAIEKMNEDYMCLKVAGLEDQAGYEACKDARKVVRTHRIAVDAEKERLANEAEKKAQDDFRRRVTFLQDRKATFDIEEIRIMSNEDFNALAHREESKYVVAEEKRKADEKELAEQREKIRKNEEPRTNVL